MTSGVLSAPRKNGVESAVITQESPDTIYVIADLSRGGAQVGFVHLCRLGFLRTQSTRLLVLGAADPLILAEIEALGRWAEIRLAPPAPAPLRWIAGLVDLVRMLRANEASIVILSLEPANMIGRLVRPFWPRALFCSFEHSTKVRRWIYRRLLPLLSGGIDAVLSDSAATCQAMASYYRPRADRLWLDVPLFAMDPHIRPKPSYTAGIPLRLLSVGRLVPAKDHGLLLEAIAELCNRDLPVSCTVVGEGPLRSELERRRTALGLDSVVRFIGDDPAWTRWAHEFDIYLQTSEREGACLTVLEAMTAGLPVIATAVGAIPDHLGSDRGLLIRQRTPSVIAESVMALARNEALRARLGRNARAWVEAEHAPGVVRSRLRAARLRLLERRKALCGTEGPQLHDDIVSA